MKIPVIHNRYRPTPPTGENAVSMDNPHRHSTLPPATHVPIYPVCSPSASYTEAGLGDPSPYLLNFTAATSLRAASDWQCLITHEHREGTSCGAPTGRFRRDRRGSKYG